MRVPSASWWASGLVVAVGVVAVGGCDGKFGSRSPDPEPPAPGPRPTFGQTVQAQDAPPAIAGGTLLTTRSANIVVAADPDRDRIEIVDIDARAVTHLALNAGDEPGRAAEDAAGRVHVVLRRGGAVVTIDVGAGAITARRDVCPAPRGIAYDPLHDTLFVACAGGELVSLPAASGSATMLNARLAPDLRDVVVTTAGGPTAESRVLVSTFRTAEVLTVSRAGAITDRHGTPDTQVGGFGTKAAVAWRMVADTQGGVAVVHQRARDPLATPVPVGAGGYTTGGGSPGPNPGPTDPDAGPPNTCQLGIVQAAVTIFDPSGTAIPGAALSRAVLPVDIAMGDARVAVAAAGNGKTPELDQIYVFDSLGLIGGTSGDGCLMTTHVAQPKGQAIAVVFDARGRLLVQTREPSTIVVDVGGAPNPTVIALADDSREDTGHSIFHSNAGGFIACASCHPEAGDDGRVWNFEETGNRRTQNLRGGVLANAPFHWDGKLPDLSTLMGVVFTKRMSGHRVDGGQLAALGHWVDSVPLIPASAPVDPAAVERGRAVFADPSVGCTSCHSGPTLTSHAIADVGTGQPFKVPSLRGVGMRAPFMHDGCAAALLDRFDPSCGGGKHGNTGGLVDTQLRDLVAFLETE